MTFFFFFLLHASPSCPLTIYYTNWKFGYLLVLSKEKKDAFMYRYYWYCHQGKAWWREISCCKGDRSGEKETEILLCFVYRNKPNKKLYELLEIFSFLSLMFPCTIWLLLFILWSLKQDQNSFTCSTPAVCRQSHFCVWKISDISKNAVKAVCHTKGKLQCYS